MANEPEKGPEKLRNPGENGTHAGGLPPSPCGMNPMPKKCPRCGGENDQSAVFCGVCGVDMETVQMDWRARILFFATPPAIMVLSIALAWDLNMTSFLETGSELGLILASLFLFLGGAFWLYGLQQGLKIDPASPWKAGIFGVIQLPVTFLLTLPVQTLWLDQRIDQIQSLTFSNESLLKLAFVLVLYFPLIFTGFFLLLKQAIQPNFKFGPSSVLLASMLLLCLMVFCMPSHQRKFMFAKGYFEIGLFQSALENVESAISENPGNQKYLHLKGLLLLGLSEYQRARESVECLRKVLEIEPANPKYCFALSVALERTGKFDEAIEVASKGISLRPREPILWNHLAGLHLRNQNRSAAKNTYKMALTLTPDDPQIMNNLAYILLELKEELPGALRLAKESVNLAPGFVYNQDTLAWALYLNGFTAEALDVIKEVKKSTQSSPEIDFHYAMIATEFGLLEKPEKAFKDILSNPQIQTDPFLKDQVIAAIASFSKTPIPKGREGEAVGKDTLAPGLPNSDRPVAEKSPEVGSTPEESVAPANNASQAENPLPKEMEK